MECDEESTMEHNMLPSEHIRERIREISRTNRIKHREIIADSSRSGFEEVQLQNCIQKDFTVEDINGIAKRIKRRRHATEVDLLRLSHAFIQKNENINAFALIPGAMEVLAKELTGKHYATKLAASECFCNLSLGEAHVCEKIVNKVGCYLATDLNSNEVILIRTALWTLTNLIATSEKVIKILLDMKVMHKLWTLYTNDDNTSYAENSYLDFREDAGECLQLIVSRAKGSSKQEIQEFVRQRCNTKNPLCAAREYHMQIIFNSDVITSNDLIAEEHMLYLINFCLRNLVEAEDFVTHTNRLRVLYAVRCLSNLVATQEKAWQLFFEQFHFFEIDLIVLLNKLFAFNNSALAHETYWFLKNLLQHKNATMDLSFQKCLLSKLRINLINMNA